MRRRPTVAATQVPAARPARSVGPGRARRTARSPTPPGDAVPRTTGPGPSSGRATARRRRRKSAAAVRPRPRAESAPRGRRGNDRGARPEHQAESRSQRVALRRAAASRGLRAAAGRAGGAQQTEAPSPTRRQRRERPCTPRPGRRRSRAGPSFPCRPPHAERARRSLHGAPRSATHRASHTRAARPRSTCPETPGTRTRPTTPGLPARCALVLPLTSRRSRSLFRSRHASGRRSLLVQ